MRRWREPTKAETLEDIRESACIPEFMRMNRAERRTAKGKMLKAQNDLAVLRAENEFLKRELVREK